ncbi:uracil phosphoribosyltransferase [Facilibium subflavum]|uniref:uracil phosphoribosyltransferase n=1 Tax=Facilibium subflavum TaxID=2219058 RepID=UPI000E64962D|nr:uracil phosphoribosyltransferase [Facilibium subflavum]
MHTYEIKHPVIQHKINLLRQSTTKSLYFRYIAHELSMLLCYEALRHLPTQNKKIDHWQGQLSVKQIKTPLPSFCPILRAGLGMLEGALQVLPNAPVSMIGMKRDEKTAKAHCYYFNPCPDIENRTVVLLDPMLATASTMVLSIDKLKKHGCKDFIIVSFLCAPEGIATLNHHHPEIDLYTASIDSHLDENSFIIPGLGDAGDRLFNT